MDTEFQALVTMAQAYFDAAYDMDAGKFASLFHSASSRIRKLARRSTRAFRNRTLRPLGEDWHHEPMESSRITTGTQVPSRDRPGALSAIALAGLGGGAVDFVYACCVGLIHGRSVMRVWQGVASGWLGKAAADGGLATMALGIVTHFVIATTMAATYALVAARVKLLYRRPVLCGIAYGLVLYAVMYLVVLSLRFPSAFPRWDGVQSVTDIASHIGVGLVIAVVLSRWERRAPKR